MKMQKTIEKIMNTVDRKKVQSCCKKALKKCSFKSANDLANITDLATWLYIYGYYEEAASVCDLLSEVEFNGNYNIWWQIEYSYCLKSRILREQCKDEESKMLSEIINRHRDPKLYGNLINWYRVTLNKNISSEEKDSPKNFGYVWRIIKIKHAIKIETNIEQKLDQMTDELYNNLLLISLSDRRDGYRSRIYFSASPFRQNITYIKFVCQTDNHVPLTLPTLSELNSNDVTSILNSIEPQILNVYNVGQGNFTELIDNKGFQRKIVFDPGITCTKSHNPYDLAIKEYGQLNADCFFISHFDTDHFLGIIYLKDDQFQSNKLWIAPDPTSIKKLSTSARRIIWFLHNNAKFRIIKDSTSYYTFNKKIKVFRGTADPKSVTDNGKYINGSGIMISVEGKRKTALLTGDCLYEYWNKDVPEECDYLVVPHHGCKVDAVKIEGKQTDRSEAIISVGNGNSYGHPNSQHIKKLLDKGFNSVLLTKNITLKVYDLD